jgi:hypothetical protein
VYKYLVQRYGRIRADFEEKADEESSIMRLVRRGRQYLKDNGIKKTVRKIMQKVKGKIWKK